MLALALVVAIAPQAPKPLVDLEFEMAGNRIYLPATLNGRPTPAILDTGAGASAVDLALADELKIPGDREIQANGVGAASVKGRILTGASVDLGGQKHAISYAIPFSTLNSAEGRKLELILGYDFLQRYVFQIDYAAKRLQLHPRGTFMSRAGTEVPVRIVNGHPHIRAKITLGGQTHDVEAMIDSGASLGGLTGRFTKAFPIPSKVKTTAPTIIGGGVGGFVTGRFLRLDSVEVGGIRIKQPIVSVNEAGGGANGTQSAYDYLLGAEILKRFTVTIDYHNKRVFLKPNADFDKPFIGEQTGIRLQASGTDLRKIGIVGVMPGSSAESAGLKSGDQLVSIDGLPAASKSLQEWRDYLRNPDAKQFSFVVARDGSEVKASVIPRQII